MIRPLFAVLTTSALLLGACSTGPSAEDEARDRKAAAAKKTQAANRALGEDLISAAKAMQKEQAAKKRMDPEVALRALKAKGYAAGTSVIPPSAKASQKFCIWATSPRTKRTYVYQSLTDDARASSEPVDWCVAAEYGTPVALTAQELKRESLADAEMGLKIDRDGKALTQSLQRFADTVEKRWTITPHWFKPTNAEEKRRGAAKRKMLDKLFKDFEAPDGLQIGATFDEAYFCLVMYQKGATGMAVAYQHLDKKVVRVKAGSTTCSIGTVPRP